ncbi:unnamed protein product [Toxocara canis]|uniref:BTB domain-containing protein n=1 Tax=Toxocara canis TaxID=6265 RepID=A0A183V034_TOXCA|nr:unnamed protein product [Toxocara canis]
MDDDSDFIASSFKPSKNPTTSKRSSNEKLSELPPKKFVIESDCLFREAKEDCCYVCNKDLRQLDELRKALHINNCLDQQEAKNKYKSEREKWSKTVDCPLCGTPLQPGPFRAAHAKSCGRKHEVSSAQLLSLMEAQTKVADVRKKNGLSHTKSLQMYFHKNNFFSETISTSNSLHSSNVSVPERKVRSRKLRPRSYSFVELEPLSCRCSVFEQIQENFLRMFSVKRPGDFVETMQRRRMRTSLLLGDINKCIRKLERLERLADDLNRFGSSGGDISIFSLENEAISVHRFIIAARAPLLLPIFRCYVRFLYSSAMEWTENERSEVLELAVQYGPAELAPLCHVQSPPVVQEETSGKSSEPNFKINDLGSTERDAEKQTPISFDHSPDLLTGNAQAKDCDSASGLALNVHSNEMEDGSGRGSVTSSLECDVKQELKNGYCGKDGIIHGGERLLETMNAGASSTAMQCEDAVDASKGKKGEGETKEAVEDSDDSVVFVDEVRNTNKPTVGKIDEVEDWEMDSGSWLERLLPRRDVDGLKSAKSKTPTRCRDLDGSPDVLGVSSDDDEGGVAGGTKILSRELSNPVCSDGFDKTPSKESLSPKAMGGTEEITKLTAEEGRGSSVVSANASMNESFRYSPLPLPTDSFYDDIHSPQNVSPDHGRIGESLNGFTNLLVGAGAERKHKSVGCSPSISATSAHHFSFASVADELRDSFFDSSLTQPMPSKESVPNHSSRLSEILRSPLQGKYRHMVANESLKCSTRPNHTIHNSPIKHSNGGDCVQHEKFAFDVSFSPIHNFHDQPCTSHMSPAVAPTEVGVKTSVQYCSTPNPTSTRIARRLKELGSNVKVLKMSDITPLPDFAQMNDKQLKREFDSSAIKQVFLKDELAKYGVRPLGRKRAIALLKKIYDELHPVIDDCSPVSSKPKSRIAVANLANRIDDALEEEDDLGDKTLNRSLNAEDILEESCIDIHDEDAPLPKVHKRVFSTVIIV